MSVSTARKLPKLVLAFIKSQASCSPNKDSDLAGLPVRTVIEHHIP